MLQEDFPVDDGLPDRVRDVLLDDGAAAVRERLAGDIVGWLTTIAPDGRPQTSVISFLWDGEGILFYSKPNTPKVRNIELHPAVSFHLNCDPYGDHYVVVEGRARIAPDELPSDVHLAYRAKYEQPLAHWKMDEKQTADEFSVPIRIEPDRIRIE